MTYRPEDDEIARLIALTDNILGVLIGHARLSAAHVQTLETRQAEPDLIARKDAERVVTPRRHRHHDTTVVLRYVSRDVIPQVGLERRVVLHNKVEYRSVVLLARLPPDLRGPVDAVATHQH